MSDFDTKLHAMQAGYDGFVRGLQLCDNPYPRNHPLKRLWSDGWKWAESRKYSQPIPKTLSPLNLALYKNNYRRKF